MVPQEEDMKSDTWNLLLSLDTLSINKTFYHLYIYLGSQRPSKAPHPESGVEMLLLKQSLFQVPKEYYYPKCCQLEAGGKGCSSGCDHCAVQSFFLHIEQLPPSACSVADVALQEGRVSALTMHMHSPEQLQHILKYLT